MVSETLREHLRMRDGDRVVVAWPENCRFPGGSNLVAHVIIRERGGKLREEMIQVIPAMEQGLWTESLSALMEVAELVTSDFTLRIENIVEAERMGESVRERMKEVDGE